MACSLYVILARKARRAVVLRRRGTHLVRLILWHTDTDEFEPGQWFKGRIHGELSDLSPNGSLFIYAAGKWSMSAARAQEYGYAWTAISRPPYFTALALWPAAKAGGPGSVYDGGGLFVDQRTVLLDHWGEMAVPHRELQPPRRLRVLLADQPHFGFPDPAGGGTLPIEFYRLVRDGWRVVQRIGLETSGRYRGLIQPWILERANPGRSHVLVLQEDHRYIWGGSGREYRLRDAATGEEQELEGVQWADWDHAGRLAFAREGSLLACSAREPIEEAKLLADFSAQTFESIVAPDWAGLW